MLSRIARITTTMGVQQFASQGHTAGSGPQPHRQDASQDGNLLNRASHQWSNSHNPQRYDSQWEAPVRHRNSNSNGSDPFLGQIEDGPAMHLHEDVLHMDCSVPPQQPPPSEALPFQPYTYNHPVSSAEDCILATEDSDLDWINQLESPFDFLPLSPPESIDSVPIASQQVAVQQPLSSSPILPQSGPLYLPNNTVVSAPAQSQNSPFYSSSPIGSTNCLLDLDSIENSIDWKAWDDYLSTEEFDCKQELPSPGIDLSAPMKDLELGDSAIHSAKDEYDTNAENFSYHEVKASPFVITGSQFKPVGNLAHILQQTTQALLTQEAAQSGPLTLDKEKETGRKKRASAANASRVWRKDSLNSPVNSSLSSLQATETDEDDLTDTTGDLNALDRAFGSHEKPKKRGVKLKPSVDDETDRRRALNREAALRYREKKREERQKMQSVSSQLEERNKELKTTSQALEKEIAVFRAKLMQRGIL
ncbi:hypothetical protein WR25_12406 [Diploscapter pachys]|uniref:BZIP domain-containing protein n=1 Tax=Diploscapter pachys TaxID=2018661 RepID=A0A2A2JN88_9BILA|nr:hypothetical protein WR25_12406 [Diploscapter pachys]